MPDGFRFGMTEERSMGRCLAAPGLGDGAAHRFQCTPRALRHPPCPIPMPIPIPALPRSEEHTSELQSLMRISYAVFCLKKHTIETSNHLPEPRYAHQHSA